MEVVSSRSLTFTAVSYTHLDVYKRQECGKRLRSFTAGEKLKIINEAEVIGNVYLNSDRIRGMYFEFWDQS